MSTQNIQQKYDDAVGNLQKIIDLLCLKIESLPDNPRIKRASGSPNCFTISSKDLFTTRTKKGVDEQPRQVTTTNWSVEHHDFKRQYQIITEVLKKASLGNGINVLKQIIEMESVTKPDHRSVNLHPDVVSHLKSLMYEINS